MPSFLLVALDDDKPTHNNDTRSAILGVGNDVQIANEENGQDDNIVEQVVEDDSEVALVLDEGAPETSVDSAKLGDVEKLDLYKGKWEKLLNEAASLPMFTSPVASSVSPPEALEFNGAFPILAGNVLPLLRESIEGCDDFITTDCGEYVVFDYSRVTRDTFPDPTLIPRMKNRQRQRWLLAARRECRGLVIARATGCVLARRFHKFFNVDERPEAAADTLPPLDSSVVLLEKIDGSLVSPLLLPPVTGDTRPRLLWISKSQHMKQIDAFVISAAIRPTTQADDDKTNGEGCDYIALAVEWITAGYTPLFEWCQPGVGIIQHTEPSLILLAIRHNERGDYLAWDVLVAAAAKHRVPLTPRIPLDLQRTPTVDSLKAHVDLWEPGREGLVVIFPQTGGLIYKLKSHWYRTLHANSGIANLAKVLAERPNLHGVPLGMVWTAVLADKVDDILPLLRSPGNHADADALADFVTRYHGVVKKLLYKFQEWGASVRRAVAQLSAESGQLALLGGTSEKAQELILQQILWKLLYAQADPHAVQQQGHNYHGWRKTTLQAFAKPASADVQENALRQELKTLASKGKWRQLEQLLELSWEKHLANPSVAHDNEIEAKDKLHNEAGVDASPQEDASAIASWPLQIYCDLDGVLADFEAGIQRMSKNNNSNIKVECETDPAKVWGLVRKNKSFWKSLDMMEGGEALWAFLQSRPCGAAYPKILTGVPEGKMGAVARKQKTIWCHKHLSEEVEVLTCHSSKKSEHSRLGSILIDDRESMREAWERKGGTFVHHVDADTTLAQLRKVLPEVKAHLEAAREVLLQAAATQQKYTQQQKVDEEQEKEQEGDDSDGIYRVRESGIVVVEGESGLAAFVAALQQAKMVGIDVEWPPDDYNGTPGGQLQLNAASLLQVAVSETQVFLVDMYALHASTRQAIAALLASPDIVKLAFGLYADIQRLGHLHADQTPPTVEATLDLAIAIPACVPTLTSSSSPVQQSLAKTVERVLGMRMLKSKLLQACDWAVRPLPLAQQQYAAADAAVLLRLHHTLAQWPAFQRILCACITRLDVVLLKRGQLRHHQQDKDYSHQSVAITTNAASGASRANRSRQRVTLQYSAVFLTSQARTQLLAAFPPHHSQVWADHVTLCFAPTLDDVRDLPVGRPAQVRVLSQVADSLVQAVVVQLLAPSGLQSTNAVPHVTISTRPGVPPNQANALLLHSPPPPPPPLHASAAADDDDDDDDNNMDALLLDGVVGLVVTNEFVTSELPAKILQELEDFATHGLPGQSLEFGKKQPLTAIERQALHKYAEEHGLESKSSGQKHHRVITVRKPRKVGEGEATGTIHELRIMKSGNEEENRRLTTKNKGKAVPGSSTGQPQYIEVKDEATLQSLQLVFKSLGQHTRGGTGSGSQSTAHGRVLRDGTIEPLLYEQQVQPHHELLFALFDGSHSITSDDTTRVVVVMRGLPGSGKSSVIASLKGQLSAESLAYCSADEYWARGGGRYNKRELKHMQQSEGKTTDDIYRECFDERRLHEAHAFCRTQFEEALGSHPVVVVDNVNAQQRDYAHYVSTAVARGYQSVVLEILCTHDQQLTAFHRRCRHGVPMRSMAALWTRWESDPSAVTLLPYLPESDQQQSTAHTDDKSNNNVYDDDRENNSSSLLQWLSSNRLFASGKRRNPSHMIVELVGRPVKLLEVPADRHTEFLRHYVADDSPQFIVEFCSSPVFRLFIDLDYVARTELTEAGMVRIVQVIQQALATLYPQQPSSLFQVIVTGGHPYQHAVDQEILNNNNNTTTTTTWIKSGKHLHFPHLLVTIQQAIYIRQIVVAHLRQTFGEDSTEHQPWELMLDPAVYGGTSPGIRLLGSRKTCRDGSGTWVDVGNVHFLQAVIDGQGALDYEAFAAYSVDRVALMEVSSIRSAATTPTPCGFSTSTTDIEDNGGNKSSLIPTMRLVEFDDLQLKSAKQKLVTHVLQRYLPRKLANYLGVPLKELNDDTIVHVPAVHSPSEGKIRGMWEQFVKDGIVDLRVDLQPPRREGHTSHYGDEHYANWQVQFGPSKVCKTSSRARVGQEETGAFAGVLMSTNTDFSVRDLTRAMALSFAKGKYVRLEMRAVGEGGGEQEEQEVSSTLDAKDNGTSSEDNEENDVENEDEDEEKEKEQEESEESEKEEEEVVHDDRRGGGRGKGRKKMKHGRKARHAMKHTKW